ncbi:MAG: cyclic nucleotide-binding domain-containing protein [Alphaproteobacteria bacterium]|nr:cyclic nucleotide-binding domain-containing protein [Alphaproteobacteria bacterium]
MAKVTAREIATQAEREALYAFRYKVYVSELAMTDEADHERGWLYDDYDERCINYALFDGDEVVGSLRVIRMSEVKTLDPFIEKFSLAPALAEFGPEPIVTTSRFMIADRLRNSMAIFRLLQKMWESATKFDIRLNYGDCSPHLVAFYERLGYRRYVDGFNDDAYGFKLPLLMIVRDNEFMRRVRSPFAAMNSDDGDDGEARDWFTQTYPDYATLDTASFLSTEVFFDLLAARLADDPLHSVALLRGLDQDEAGRFLAKAAVVRFKPGNRIVEEGEHDRTIFAILKGVAEVRPKGGEASALAVLGAGDTFGEIGFLTAAQRTADIVARTEGEALVLSAEFLDIFMRDEPTIAAKISLNLARELAGRLALASEELAAMRQPRE